jgi:hypothetical protein
MLLLLLLFVFVVAAAVAKCLLHLQLLVGLSVTRL